MAQWVLWDDEKDEYKGMVRALPTQLEGRESSYLNLLGYRELLIAKPEDAIQRFPGLLGSAVFTRQDTRVVQSYPDADFSVAAVRRELVKESKIAAGRELGKSDWYVTRQAELGTEIPEDVVTLRRKIREHTDWVEADVAKTAPRDLVDYQWFYPQNANQDMVEGRPIYVAPLPPPHLDDKVLPLEAPRPELPEVPEVVHTDEVLNPPPNTQPAVIHTGAPLDPVPVPADPPREEPPVTTDGVVPVFMEGETRPHLDSNGIPLVNVYAPNVEDIGPRPDNE